MTVVVVVVVVVVLMQIIRTHLMQHPQPLPANQRLIVVATNVAETSVTLPDVRYVVDRYFNTVYVLYLSTVCVGGLGV